MASDLPQDLQGWHTDFDVDQLGVNPAQYLGDADMHQHYRVHQWQSEHIKSWVLNVCAKYKVQPDHNSIIRLCSYQGFQLRHMSLQDFCAIDRTHGVMFYNQLQAYLREEEGQGISYPTESTADSTYTVLQTWPSTSSQAQAPFPSHSYSSPQYRAGPSQPSISESVYDEFERTLFQDFREMADLEGEGASLSDGAATLDSGAGGPPGPSDAPLREQEREGRRKRTKGPKVWQFLWERLQDPACNPSIIRWENEREYCFRLVNPHELAKMWGQRKGENTAFSYDYFARCVRYHYSTGFLVSVPEKKLVFKFGEKSIGKFGRV